MVDVVVEGQVAPGFERVVEAFERGFADHAEVGASLSAVVDGRTVVDVWAGWTDRARTTPWQRDTIVNLYSSTKGFVAAAAAILADRGLLDVDAPVTRYWPEFGQAGKETIPVRWLLSHQAGLPVIDEPLPPGGALDWTTMIQALERQHVLAQIDTLFLLEFVAQIIHQALVEILAAEEGVAVGRQHLELLFALDVRDLYD